jgi:Ca2+-binding RTX toxin-like protein
MPKVKPMGTNQDDVLVGTTGNDVIDGRRGDDVLEGGFGNDTLTGGAGADVFAFNFVGTPAHLETYDGLDTITDFTAAEGDVLRADGVTDAARFLAQIRFYDTGDGDTLVAYAGRPFAVLDGIASDDASLNWFAF